MGSEHNDCTGWVVVLVKPNREQTVARILEQKGYEVMIPSYHRRSHRGRLQEEPVWPQYVFCRLYDNRKPSIVRTPGVIRIVAPVEAGDIEFIKKVLRFHVFENVNDGIGLLPGRKVIFTVGSFRGTEGILVRVKTWTALVNVSIFDRDIIVEVDKTWIGPTV